MAAVKIQSILSSIKNHYCQFDSQFHPQQMSITARVEKKYIGIISHLYFLDFNKYKRRDINKCKKKQVKEYSYKYYTNLKFALPTTRTPNVSQCNIGRVGSPTQNFRVGHVHFMLFVLISYVLVTQCEPNLQWDMGFIQHILTQRKERTLKDADKCFTTATH